MTKVLPDPDNARTSVLRYKEENKRISKGKKDILELLASHSCFLSRVILKDPGILDYLSKSNQVKKKKTPSAYTNEAATIALHSNSEEELQSALRTYKYRELSRIIYRDLKGYGSFPEIMEELSDLASGILRATLNYYRKEVGAEPHDEFVVLAMGKFGGRELNLSSDIDLIYLYRVDSDPDPFFKLAEKITKSLSAVTQDGFLYRVDLALRPGGGKSTVAVPIEGALEHYFYWGDTWERAAMIKARPVAGDLELGEEFIREIEPFVYKKYLDYASIENLKDMKTRLDQLQKKRNVKLGRGGIREIEFFVQALQLVNGGEIKEIRGRNTLKTLRRQRAANMIDEEVYETLSSSYIFLRKVEHMIQLVEERQTHTIPSDPDDIERLARRLGLGSGEEFEKEYKEHTDAVSAIYKKLFFEPSQKTEEVGKEFWEVADFLTVGNISEEEALENLANLGFRHPETAIELFSTLLDPRKGGLTEEGRIATKKVVPAFLARILQSPDPDSALLNLERFISGIGLRTSIYAVLSENPDIIELLSKLFTTSGYLSGFLIRHPEYLDAITLRDVRAEFGSKDDMLAQLREALAEEEDYEGKLDALRNFRNVETLKICLRDLNGEVDPFYVGRYLSMTAETVLESGLELAWETLPASVRKKIARPKMLILGLGKLGGGEMSYNSDLDIMFIYEGKDHELYSKLGQKVISVLSVPTVAGYAYKIDMGLRPSGRSGALVTSFDSFKKYHENSALIWERQALIRAKVSAGDKKLGKKVMDQVERFVYIEPIEPGFYKEIYRLRERMEKELAKETEKKLNMKTGRGGIVDIEFLVQMLQIRHGGESAELRAHGTMEALEALHSANIIQEKEYRVLSEGLLFLKKMENMLRLLHDRSINELHESDFEKLAAELDTKADGEGLKKKYVSKTNKIRKIYEKYFTGANS